MSVQPTEAVTAGVLNAQQVGTAASEDKQMFLELMVAQLRYQDPLNPTDSGEFLSQTAQFNALEQMTKVADQTATLVATQLAFGAAGMVGRDVTWLDADGNATTGRVDGVAFTAEGPMLQVGGVQVPLALVQSLAAPAPSTADSDSSTTDTSASA